MATRRDDGRGRRAGGDGPGVEGAGPQSDGVAAVHLGQFDSGDAGRTRWRGGHPHTRRTRRRTVAAALLPCGNALDGQAFCPGAEWPAPVDNCGFILWITLHGRRARSCESRVRFAQWFAAPEGELERAKGFEPSTPTLARSCSTP